MNSLELNGKICQQKVFKTSDGGTVTHFALNFYNGKKNGENQYAFIDCKMFSAINIADKSYVTCKGWIASESWEKDGKKYSRLVFKVKDIEIDDKKPSQNENVEPVDIFPDKDVEPFNVDDAIPF